MLIWIKKIDGITKLWMLSKIINKIIIFLIIQTFNIFFRWGIIKKMDR